MERLQGLFGVALILGIAVAFSNNRRKIDLRLVLSGLSLQIAIALLVFKVGPVARFFRMLGQGIGKPEEFAHQGASFVYGNIAVEQKPGTFANYPGGGFVFAFNVTATIVLVCALAAVHYHCGVLAGGPTPLLTGWNFFGERSGVSRRLYPHRRAYAQYRLTERKSQPPDTLCLSQTQVPGYFCTTRGGKSSCPNGGTTRPARNSAWFRGRRP